MKGMTARAKKGKRKKQKAGLNRSILEVGFGIIGNLLTYKAAVAGGFYVESPTRTLKPTQRCAKLNNLLKAQYTLPPQAIAVDKNAAYPVAIEMLKADGTIEVQKATLES